MFVSRKDFESSALETHEELGGNQSESRTQGIPKNRRIRVDPVGPSVDRMQSATAADGLRRIAAAQVDSIRHPRTNTDSFFTFKPDRLRVQTTSKRNAVGWSASRPGNVDGPVARIT